MFCPCRFLQQRWAALLQLSMSAEYQPYPYAGCSVQGEPFIVQLGWSAVAASFSFSLAMVVWGRSGM